MSSASYLLNRGGYYHFRIRIPSDLLSAIPQKEIVKSLKTKEKGLARVAALSYQQGIFKTFSLLRTGFISGEQARGSLKSLLDGHIKCFSKMPSASIKNAEYIAMLNALKIQKWNISNAAKTLCISRATMYRKMKQYNIIPPNEQ